MGDGVFEMSIYWYEEVGLGDVIYMRSMNIGIDLSRVLVAKYDVSS